MKDPVPAPVITEAAVIAWLAAKRAEFAPRFFGIRDFRVGIDAEKVTMNAYPMDSYDFIYGSGATLEDAASEFLTKTGTPETKAAELRRKAAELMAKADALLAPPPPPADSTPVPSTETPAT